LEWTMEVAMEEVTPWSSVMLIARSYLVL